MINEEANTEDSSPKSPEGIIDLRPYMIENMLNLKYIRAREKSIVIIDTKGNSYICFRKSTPKILQLNSPEEFTISAIIHSEYVYTIVKREFDNYIRIFRQEIDRSSLEIRNKIRVLRYLHLEPREIRQIDPFNMKLIAQKINEFQVWNLLEETLVFSSGGQYGLNAWYSRNNAIISIQSNNSSTLAIKNLQSKRNHMLKLKEIHSILSVEVINLKIIVNTPVSILVIDSRSLHCIKVICCRPRFYIEMEQYSDSIILFEEGFGQYIIQNEFQFSCQSKDLLFADSRYHWVILDGNQLISPKETCTLKLDYPPSAIALDNYDTIIACSNGLILIYK